MNLSPSSPGEVDCLVLGGGITGAGIARDLGMRGLRTALVDSHDFASGTSHLTSKLIHGGLRYLDQGKIRLAAEGVMERDRLLNRMAPNLVRPLKFIIPYEGRHFPKWLFTVVGIQSYGFVELCRSGRGSKPLLAPQLRRDYPGLLEHPFGVSYWDARTNDARLVLATLRTAHAHGAALFNYTTIEDARFEDDVWRIVLRHEGCPIHRHAMGGVSMIEAQPRAEAGGLTSSIIASPPFASQRIGHPREGFGADGRWTLRARVVVNATGPWAPDTCRLLGVEPVALLWIKGSHLLLRRPSTFGDDAIIIRSIRDHRPLWVIPWETRLIVGSTERRYHGDLREVRADRDEIDDLWSSVLHYFPRHGFTREDICGAYAGVRPIVEQAGESENRLSRKFEIITDAPRRLITVNGGKLTTFRRMAEQTVDAVERLLTRPEADAAMRRRLRSERLWPGLSSSDASQLAGALRAELNGAPATDDVLDHLVRLYGTDAREILACPERQWHQPLFDQLPYTLAELAYLCRTEQVQSLLDLIKRRTSIYFLADRAGVDQLNSIVRAVAPILGWDAARIEHEIEDVQREFAADCTALGPSASSPRLAPQTIGA